MQQYIVTVVPASPTGVHCSCFVVFQRGSGTGSKAAVPLGPQLCCARSTQYSTPQGRLWQCMRPSMLLAIRAGGIEALGCHLVPGVDAGAGVHQQPHQLLSTSAAGGVFCPADCPSLPVVPTEFAIRPSRPVGAVKRARPCGACPQCWSCLGPCICSAATGTRAMPLLFNGSYSTGWACVRPPGPRRAVTTPLLAAGSRAVPRCISCRKSTHAQSHCLCLSRCLVQMNPSKHSACSREDADPYARNSNLHSNTGLIWLRALILALWDACTVVISIC
jgi:hypothetical protein